MSDIKYLGTTFDNVEKKLWVKVRNDGTELIDTRIIVNFYRDTTFAEKIVRDRDLNPGEEWTQEFNYPPPDAQGKEVNIAKITIYDKHLDETVAAETINLGEVEIKYVLKGVVTDTEGNPLDFATVNAFGIETKTTAANGRYRFEFDQGYSGEVTASKPGYKEQTKTITLKEGTNELNFELEKETPSPPPEKHNRIYGVVKGPLGEPVPYATIIFGGKSAVTGNDGRYEILDVWYSGEIVCQAPGYETASQIIEAPLEGDLEVNFTLAQKPKEAPPEVDVTPLVSPLQGVDAKLQTFPVATELAKQQLQTQRVQGELDETLLATALRQVGLDDWADKYTELYNWLTENFGVPYTDPITGEKKKIIFLAPGFQTKLGDFAGKAGISATTVALRKAQGAIAGVLGGLTAGSLISGITGVLGTIIFTEFICEEAVQTAGMGVYMASQTKDPEVVRQALENYKNILNATKQIHDAVKYLDPIGSSFEAFFVAAENNITNYENLIKQLENREEEKRELARSLIEDMYELGMITKDDAINRLKEIKYSEEAAKDIIAIIDEKKKLKSEKEIKELNRSLLDRLFIADLISEDDYRNKLRELGYTDEDIDLLVNLAKTKKEVRVEEPKVLSKSDVLKAYREELIDEETAKKKLKELNYTDEDIELLLNMSAREKLGKLRVTSKPTRAMIIINDNPINLLTPETIELAPGNYSVTVSMEGYKTPEPKDVVIEEEGRTEVHFDLERMKIGYLTIRSRPSQAAIYINGVDTKLLTPQTFELEEGKYTITLKYHGYKDKEFEVEIKEGETIEKFLRLTRE